MTDYWTGEPLAIDDKIFLATSQEFLTEYRFDPNQFSTMHRARIKKKWENAHATCKRRRAFSEQTIIVGMREIDPQATLDRTGRRGAGS
jgi:hypothetical protein